MEDFVPYELAVKLKEKGFNEDCYTVYNTLTMRIERSLTSWKDYKGVIIAPTISQVLKWLREEKKVYIAIAYMPQIKVEGKFKDDFYYPTIQIIGKFKPIKFCDGDYPTYEQASFAGIEYVIDNLI